MQLRLSVEEKWADELAALRAADRYPHPQGWWLSPRMVETFILGTDTEYQTPDGKNIPITRKYWGDRAMIQVAIATLASERALLLLGEPGTAKSWLSEHLAAAISGTSQLIVQGTAGTTEEHIKYSWNYAMLIAQGPKPEALVQSPMMRGMQTGQVVRFEELTRCHSEVQDTLISILSEKQVAVPELNQVSAAEKGWNVIATANTRDRGVNDMSSALKRRFNFVVVPPLDDLETEVAVVEARTAEMLNDMAIAPQIPRDLVRVLTTVFAELRQGRTLDGSVALKKPSSVLSTAELISVLTNAALLAAYFGNNKLQSIDAARVVAGAVAKEKPEDLACFRDYLENVVRMRIDPVWMEFYHAGHGVAG